MKLIIASANQHKIEEIKANIPVNIELASMKECGIIDEIPENELTLEGNALEKMRYVYERTNENCFADDTGLEVEHLNGDPGVRSARYATGKHDHKANIELLLKNLKGVKNRNAQFRTVIALKWMGKEYLFQGVVKGEIIDKEEGEMGFGYDAIFVPEGHNKTFAQMTINKKNQMSHRSKATKKLVAFLCEQEPK